MFKTRNKIKLGIVIVIVLISFALSTVFYQLIHRQNQKVIKLPDAATDALLTLAGFQKTAMKNGKRQWKLEAEAAELVEGAKIVRLRSPKIEFFLEDGSWVALTATRGELYTDSNDMQVEGSVHLSNESYDMRTESLVYHHDARLLTADDQVSITGQGARLEADSMTYHIDTSEALFGGHVKGNILSEFQI